MIKSDLTPAGKTCPNVAAENMKSWLKDLKDTQRKGLLVKIDRRPITKELLEGFVVGLSKKFILLNVLSPDIRLDGYSIIRTGDVKRYAVIKKNNTFIYRALVIRKNKPCPQPVIELESEKAGLVSASSLYPLLSVFREKIEEEVCYIGRPSKFGEGFVALKEINTKAKWNGLRKIKLNDITRIDFGGGYEEALAIAAGEKPKRKP
jgi:hypothetical protein